MTEAINKRIQNIRFRLIIIQGKAKKSTCKPENDQKLKKKKEKKKLAVLNVNNYGR